MIDCLSVCVFVFCGYLSAQGTHAAVNQTIHFQAAPAQCGQLVEGVASAVGACVAAVYAPGFPQVSDAARCGCDLFGGAAVAVLSALCACLFLGIGAAYAVVAPVVGGLGGCAAIAPAPVFLAVFGAAVGKAAAVGGAGGFLGVDHPAAPDGAADGVAVFVSGACGGGKAAALFAVVAVGGVDFFGADTISVAVGAAAVGYVAAFAPSVAYGGVGEGAVHPPAVVVKMGLVFVAAADVGALGFDVAADGGGRRPDFEAVFAVLHVAACAAEQPVGAAGLVAFAVGQTAYDGVEPQVVGMKLGKGEEEEDEEKEGVPQGVPPSGLAVFRVIGGHGGVLAFCVARLFGKAA